MEDSSSIIRFIETRLNRLEDKLDVRVDQVNEKLLRIEDRHDVQNKEIAQINQTLTRQEAVLEEHQRRSIANEEAVQILKNQLDPISEHVKKLQTITSFIMWFVGVTASTAILAKTLGLI